MTPVFFILTINMLYIQKKTEGIIFKVIVQPNASQNTIVGLFDDAVKIKLKAPPVDGAANKMCVKYLSKYLKIPKSFIKITKGHKSRIKHIFIKNQSYQDSYENFEEIMKHLGLSPK